jgi:hypothetical protein
LVFFFKYCFLLFQHLLPTLSLYDSLCSYLYYLVVSFFTPFVFFSNYYTKTKKIMFIYSNCNTVLLSYYIKNQLNILQVFINSCDFYYVVLYADIDFLIHSYIFYSMSKNMLIISTHDQFSLYKKNDVSMYKWHDCKFCQFFVYCSGGKIVFFLENKFFLYIFSLYLAFL